MRIGTRTAALSLSGGAEITNGGKQNAAIFTAIVDKSRKTGF